MTGRRDGSDADGSDPDGAGPDRDRSGEERAAIEAAARGGLCGRCRHARGVVSARGSAFLRCAHPRLPKYPPQPIGRCDGFGPRSESPETPS